MVPGSHVTITHDALDLVYWAPIPCRHEISLYWDPTGCTPLQTWSLPLYWDPLPLVVTSSCQDWRPIEICSLEQHIEAHTVGKRAVRILLNAFLFISVFVLSSQRQERQLQPPDVYEPLYREWYRRELFLSRRECPGNSTRWLQRGTVLRIHEWERQCDAEKDELCQWGGYTRLR